MKSPFLFLVLAIALLPISLYSQETIVIGDSISQRTLQYQDYEVLEDAKGALTFEEVSSVRFEKAFKLNKSFVPKSISSESAYWIRVRIQNNAGNEDKWILEFPDNTIDSIQAYLPTNDGTYFSKNSGDAFIFTERKFVHKNFQFPIYKNGEGYYYFRFKSAHPFVMRIVARSVSYFIFYSLNEYLLYGLFYGMIFVIAIYNLLMFLAVKEIAYVYYILYCLSIMLYFMCTDGIAFQYLWPTHPDWNEVSYGVALFMVVISMLLFCKYFLNTSSHSPLLDKALTVMIALRLLVFLFSFFVFPSLFKYKLLDFIYVSTVFYAGIYSLYVKKYRPARFYVAAYGMLFAGFMLRILVDVGLIPFFILSHYSLNICFILETIALSFAMADKIRIIRMNKEMVQAKIILQLEENERLKEKVNKELEGKVQERTRELNEKNILLEEQAEQITKMNQLLDMDNYKLKKNIDEVQVARVMKKDIDFEEFKEIFPDELTCLRYLEEVKWSTGFKCKKCKNLKCFESKMFSRRCTKCGYNESATAYTIFQGSKFEIQKAFFIVYLIITERNNLTIDQLSEMLDLSRNTCWNFKNKVSQKIDSAKAKRAREAMKNWGHIVFKDE